MAKHLIMDQSGHSTIEFDDVKKAREHFNTLLKKGYRAAVRSPDGNHKLVNVYDINADETLFIPALKGG